MVNGKVYTTKEMVVWTDASDMALEVDGDIIEDGSWLRSKSDAAHINLREIDAALCGINVALEWDYTSFTLVTDSLVVANWIRNTICKTKYVKTKAMAEVCVH